MPVATVTYTGKIGPGITQTAIVYNNVKSMLYDYVGETITINWQGNAGPVESIVSLSGVTTITTTVSGGVISVTIS